MVRNPVKFLKKLFSLKHRSIYYDTFNCFFCYWLQQWLQTSSKQTSPHLTLLYFLNKTSETKSTLSVLERSGFIKMEKYWKSNCSSSEAFGILFINSYFIFHWVCVLFKDCRHVKPARFKCWGQSSFRSWVAFGILFQLLVFAITHFIVKDKQNLPSSCSMKSLREYGTLAALLGEQQTLALCNREAK